MSDYDFENPATSLLAQVKTPGKHQFGDFETFEYHGAYSKASQGDALSRIRVEEHRSGAEEFGAETVCRSIDVGSKFNLSGHPRQDQNAEYLVTSVVIEANAGDFDASNQGGDFSHRTTLRAIRSQTAFRLARTVPPPMINGPQSAVVVGPSGQEIHTDKHGRIRVRFFWDRYAKGDETSSCWVRVSQPWAGKKWGGFFLPRIGHEVLVEFLGGDPERPVVTGSLYNGENAPPYALPGKQTVSTIKSLSSPGGGGFNELRFEDKKGSEQIFIHGEKDWDRRIKKDAKDWIGGDHHMMVIKDSFTDIKGDQHESVTGDRKEKVGMNASLKVGMNLDEKVGMNYALQSGMQMHLKAGLSLVIEAGMMITLKAGGGFITVGPTGVCISGTPVLINSGGAAGSGAGASPAPPTPAKEADNDKSGQATKAVKPPRPPKPTTYSPAAMVLKQAAKSGTPFCKQCAKQ
jgi:type VI secretion system secreted protein VgrG